MAEQVNEHGQQPRSMSCSSCHYKTQQMNREAPHELIQELNTDLIEWSAHPINQDCRLTVLNVFMTYHESYTINYV